MIEQKSELEIGGHRTSTKVKEPEIADADTYKIVIAL